MRPLIIPFFIPHAGCPHTCLFCDQRLISGEQVQLPTNQQIVATTEAWLARSAGRPAEVAFYGGSFTLLPQQTQQRLLAAVQPLVATGRVQGIRLSTRPDALDAATLNFLAAHQVRTIEIGVQSLNDEVLQRSGRGHTSQQSLESIQRVAAAGFQIGVQLLPGLPADTPAKALASVRGVIAAGAQFLRIYPAVVLAGTGLAGLYRQGSYQPPDLDQGVATCARLLHAALKADCPVIRIGLQTDGGLAQRDTILAGCWHPALGQLVKGELYYDLIQQLTERQGVSGAITLFCHPSRLPEVQGHSQRNLTRWQRNGLAITIQTDSSMTQHEVRLQTMQHTLIGSLITSLNYEENMHAQAVADLS
jgi:histone acetyltransferase (RNA polymerase elongator complex component)